MQKTHKKIPNLFNQVYDFISTIPEGKVSTYGEIAKKVGTRDARKIGWALHANKNPEVPCHRVVSKDGRVAKSYAFGGEIKQKEKLEKEGVKFIDDMHVDLKQCMINL